ncbi:MAG: F0F1 ATP synthase subunit delta [Deltaproteobacteria bacterium]|nr:F0F1 ATP synthase subunit delta [Deltaproteobacteria bacterium]
MIIDWFTVIAQALNFFVLVWLMKRFLYKPILDAIDAREKRIAFTLAEAEAINAEALQEKNDFQQRNVQFDRQRTTLLGQATDEAKATGKRLLTEARLAADAYSVKRQKALRREQQNLNVEISRRTREEVFAIARKTLTDLAGVSLEERMSEVFRRRLQELSDEKKKCLVKALTTSPTSVLVRSAFPLPSNQQKKIKQTLKETISPGINASFEIFPELISGIELTANGQKIAWSITEYLDSLEESIIELLQEQVKPNAKAYGEAEAELKPASGISSAAPEDAK